MWLIAGFLRESIAVHGDTVVIMYTAASWSNRNSFEKFFKKKISLAYCNSFFRFRRLLVKSIVAVHCRWGRRSVVDLGFGEWVVDGVRMLLRGMYPRRCMKQVIIGLFVFEVAQWGKPRWTFMVRNRGDCFVLESKVVWLRHRARRSLGGKLLQVIEELEVAVEVFTFRGDGSALLLDVFGCMPLLVVVSSVKLALLRSRIWLKMPHLDQSPDCLV